MLIWVSLNVCQHCSCTSVHILCTLANVVTSALAQVFSKTVIHSIESQHSFNFLKKRTEGNTSLLSAIAGVRYHHDTCTCLPAQPFRAIAAFHDGRGVQKTLQQRTKLITN